MIARKTDAKGNGCYGFERGSQRQRSPLYICTDCDKTIIAKSLDEAVSAHKSHS